MGVLHSVPLCSRGENKTNESNTGDASIDKNNNIADTLAITSQPAAVSIANENAEVSPPPEATSTPKSSSGREPRDEDHEVNISSEVESSDAEGRVILDNTSSSSDSGLEQSSSADELENIGENRPVSVIGGDVTATEDGEVTIPLDDDVEELEDPVERPPEPTVPDERVDTTSEEEEDNQDPQQQQNRDFHLKVHSGPGITAAAHNGPQPGTAVRKDTTAAISDLLSDIVGAPEVAIAGER